MLGVLQHHVQSCSLVQLLTATLGIVLTVSLVIYWYGTRTFAVLKKINLPGPKPSPFVGNLLEIQKAGGLHTFLFQCLERYGTFFTTCYGRQVVINIADAETLKQVMVKEFQKFRNRPRNRITVYPLELNVAAARDEDWKRIRHTLTPAFSAAKLKVLIDLMEKAADTLQNKLKQVADTGKSVDVKECFRQMTLEVILSTAFGIESNVQINQDSMMLEKTEQIFSQQFALREFMNSMPFLGRLMALFRSATGRFAFFIDTASGIIHFRRQQAEKGIVSRKDLIQLMLTAHEETGPEGKGSKLTNDEIVAQSIIFLLAGQETSSNALTFMTYLLAMNPEIQEKLRLEIESTLSSNPGVPLYDLLNRLEYLDCVVNESLRLYPPAYFTNRESDEACIINGVYLPAGITIQIPIYALHHDPKAWPDAEKFDPERFRASNKEKIHPFQFIPFGSGPRNCIGVRFALVEIKLTLVKLLRKYRFVRSPETQVPLQLLAGITLTARDGVLVRVESLQDNNEK